MAELQIMPHEEPSFIVLKEERIMRGGLCVEIKTKKVTLWAV